MAEVRIANRTGRELGFVSHKMGNIVSVTIVNSDDVVSVRNVRLDIVEDDAGLAVPPLVGVSLSASGSEPEMARDTLVKQLVDDIHRDGPLGKAIRRKFALETASCGSDQ